MTERHGADALADVEFAALLDSAPDAIIITDESGKLVYANVQTERMFGYTREELLGQALEILMPERFRQRHVGHREGYTADPRIRPMGSGLDLQGRRKDGTEFPVEISLSPMRTSHGTLVSAIVRDVSERRRASLELERLRRQQDLLLSSVAEGILGLDEHGRITFANAAAAKLLGYRPEEMVGKAEHDLFHAKRADGTPYPAEMCPVHRSFVDGTIHHATGESFWKKSGQPMPVDYTSAPIREGGRIVGASIIFSDVSERLRSEELVRAANKRVLSIYEGIPEAFFALDRNFRLIYVNPVAERIGAAPRESVIGKVIWEAFPDLAGTRWESEYRRAMRDRTRVAIEEFYPRLGRWFEATAYPTDDGISVYFRDITERKKGEEAQREASIARPLARRIVQDLVEQGGVAHQILTQVGRRLAADTPAKKLEDHLSAYRDMGLGSVEVEKKDGQRYSFSGQDLLERRPESRVATCSFTLGFLSEAVSRVHDSEPTLGTEIECQSRGAPRCRFIVQVKKPEEGLARRVKELI